MIKETDVTAPLYIHACDMLTAIGPNRHTSAAAQAAGISHFQESTYLTSEQVPITMALVPNAALPPPDLFLELLAELTAWEYHLLQLAHLPLAAVWPKNAPGPIPILAVLPEKHPRGSAETPEQLIRLMAQQTHLPICQDKSRIWQLGRAGFGIALDEARNLLQTGQVPYVIVGGIDSYQQERLLVNLDADGRLASAHGPSDGFIPGEGAAWLLLSLQPNDQGIALADWRLDEEPGHLYSQAPYKGDALASACRALIDANAPLTIERLYSSANGERYWAKELGVMVTRALSKMPAPLVHIHPADVWGDLGAATGPALVALAVSHLEKTPGAGPVLVSCASDQGLRTLALLKMIEN
jgi:3-oxoacyl-[acyl-carrier-protein] synthase I